MVEAESITVTSDREDVRVDRLLPAIDARSKKKKLSSSRKKDSTCHILITVIIFRGISKEDSVRWNTPHRFRNKRTNHRCCESNTEETRAAGMKMFTSHHKMLLDALRSHAEHVIG
jgi:hypothetical protein